MNANANAAQAAFEEGSRLLSSGDAANACPKFEQSNRLSSNLDVLLALADCYERQGRIASAWARFQEAATLAGNEGLANREQTARAHAAALVPYLPKLVVSVTNPSATPGLQVVRDGAVIGPDQWGVPVAADPGPYTVTASAPGRKPWQATVVVRGAGLATEATVPVLELAGAAPPVAPPIGSVVPASSGAPPPAQSANPAPEGGFGTQRAIALVSGGLGLAFITVGVVAGLQASSKRDDAKKLCTGTTCRSQQGVDDTTEAVNAGNLATAGFIAGALGVVGGITLWFTAPRSGSPSSRVGLGPSHVAFEQTW